ncbi:MAG: hypothetical protein ACREGF_06165 [Candidatus Saccharimonadales bacterium]
MVKLAHSEHKPSPADTPTKKPVDDGGKSKVRKSDRVYKADEPHRGEIAKKHQQQEQPVHPGDKG